MADDFTLVPLNEARSAFKLDEHFSGRSTLDDYVTAEERIAQAAPTQEKLNEILSRRPDWLDIMRRTYHPRFSVRHYSNHAVVAGDLDMDALAGEGIAGIVVDGDLELHGSIENWEIDITAAFLWVRGNMHCRNIIFGSMDLVVARNVTASGLIVVTYNHGHLLISGDVYADRVIIDDDGASAINGKVYAKGWNASQNAEVSLRSSEWIKEIKPQYRDEFFRKDGLLKCGNGNVDMVKALLDGRDILRGER